MNTGSVPIEESLLAPASALDLTIFTEPEKREVWQAIELDPTIFENPQLINQAWIQLPGPTARMGFSYTRALFVAEESERKVKTEWGAARTRGLR